MLIVFTGLCLLTCGTGSLGAEEALENEGADWDIIHSNCFNIYLRADANLAGIESELKSRPLPYDQTARFGEVSIADEICYRLDKLFAHVKEILNMYPDIPKVAVKIFRDRDELNEEYFRLFSSRRDLSAYYIKSLNTIYTSEIDIGDSVMIHEMAHVIIDHYFVTPPSEKVSEILASYVDAHMEE